MIHDPDVLNGQEFVFVKFGKMGIGQVAMMDVSGFPQVQSQPIDLAAIRVNLLDGFPNESERSVDTSSFITSGIGAEAL